MPASVTVVGYLAGALTPLVKSIAETKNHVRVAPMSDFHVDAPASCPSTGHAASADLENFFDPVLVANIDLEPFFDPVLGSPLQTLEDYFVPQPFTDCSIAVGYAYRNWQCVVRRGWQVIDVHQLCPATLGWGEADLIVTFGDRATAALFRLFWID